MKTGQGLAVYILQECFGTLLMLKRQLMKITTTSGWAGILFHIQDFSFRRVGLTFQHCSIVKKSKYQEQPQHIILHSWFMAYYKYVQQVMAGSISNVMVAMRCRNSRGRSCIRDPFFRNLTVAMRKSNLFQSVSSTLQSFDQDEERQLCKTTRFSITHASSSIHRSIDSEYRKTCVRNTPC